MSTASQGIWLQELVDGKQVWHFYPTNAMTIRPGAQVEAPPPVAPTDKIVVHPPGQHPGGPHFTYNVYNTYNYPAATTGAAAAAPEQKKEAAEPQQEGIRISEDEVKVDAMLHEQAEAIRMMRHLYTVDYGAGDVYGRRWVTGG